MSQPIWCLNHFYNPEELAALYEQIPRRASCRRFLSAPSAAQWSELGEAAKRLTLPGVRLELNLCTTELFQPFGGLLMKFENVQRYAAVFAAPDAVVNAGISGELLLLEAVRLGMAGVWVSGTYKRKAAPAAQPGERLLALIALGVPPEDFAVGQRNRKPLQALVTRGELGGIFREIALAVQTAPSAMNGQPWQLACEEDGTVEISVKRPNSRLDLGIAAAHALLALGSTNARFDLAPDQLSVRMKPVL